MVERADISSVLNQIRSMQHQMPKPEGVNPAGQGGINPLQSPEKPNAPSFGEMFAGAVNQVNDLSKSSSELQTAYMRGDEGVDLARVMIAMNKSSVASEALIQGRNRLVQAYESIMKMPI